MLTKLSLLAIFGLSLTSLPLVDASPCDPDGRPALGIVAIETGAGTYYIDDRGGSVWIYEECNGIPGLQRGGTHWWDPQDVDPCGDPNVQPDCLIF